MLLPFSMRQTHIPSRPMSSSGKHPAHSDFSASRNNGYGGANCGNGINVGTATQGLFTVPIKMSSAELKTGPINIERGTLSLLRTYMLYPFLSRIVCFVIYQHKINNILPVLILSLLSPRLICELQLFGY